MRRHVQEGPCTPHTSLQDAHDGCKTATEGRKTLDENPDSFPRGFKGPTPSMSHGPPRNGGTARTASSDFCS
eukprot:3458268-Pyramimonas_sp.AAC.1